MRDAEGRGGRNRKRSDGVARGIGDGDRLRGAGLAHGDYGKGEQRRVRGEAVRELPGAVERNRECRHAGRGGGNLERGRNGARAARCKDNLGRAVAAGAQDGPAGVGARRNGVLGSACAGEGKADVGHGRGARVGDGKRLRSAGHARLLVREGEAGGRDVENRRRYTRAAQGDGLGFERVGNSEGSCKHAQLLGCKDHVDGADRAGRQLRIAVGRLLKRAADRDGDAGERHAADVGDRDGNRCGGLDSRRGRS